MCAVPRGVRRAGLAALLLAVTLNAPSGAQGQDGAGSADPASAKQAVDQERRRLVQRYDETLAVEAERTAAYQQSVGAAAVLAIEVARLERSVAGVTQELERAEQRLAEALAAERRLANQLESAREVLRQRLEELRLSAIVAYVEASELGSLRGLNRAFDDQEGAIAVFYAGYVGDITDDRVQAVEEQQERIEALVDEAHDARDAAGAAQADVAAKREQAQRLRDEARAARQRVEAEAQQQQQLVAEVVAQRGRYEQEMQALSNESALLGELLRQRAATTVAPGQRGGDRPSSRPASPRPSPTAPPARTSPPANGGAQPAPTPAPAPAPSPTNPKPPPTTNNAGSGDPPAIAVSLSYPLPGYPVVSKYGWRTHPILGVRKLHEGIDIWAPAGTGISASAGGSVAWVGPRNGFGNAVVIDHGSGVATLYAHLSAFNVGSGQRVSRGATIGFVGQSGLAAGPHLHFEVRVNGRSYNPLAYVRAG
jgi:murein DD-endopeptidase MepM/ murein hydrolase activator NlpD